MTSRGSSTHGAQASHSQDPEFGRESGSDDEVGEPPASKRHKSKDLTVKTGVQNSSRKSLGTSLKGKTKSLGPTFHVQKGTLPQHEIVTCFILLFNF